MDQHAVFLLLGLANGAVFAGLALALVVTYRSSGVINFATGAIALFSAYFFVFLRLGEVLIPIPGLPRSLELGSGMAVLPAIVLTLLADALLGCILYFTTFRPLRDAPPVAKAVASIGAMVVLTGLITLRFGTNPVAATPIFATNVIVIGDVRVSADRIWFAATVVLITVLVVAGFKYTRFGLHTRAAAESEKGAYVSRISPDRIAALNWVISAVVAGLVGILISPVSPLVPYSYTLFIVPALAAAIVGGFQRVGVAVAAGLAIGMLQSEMTHLQTEYSWLPSSGLPDLVPLVPPRFTPAREGRTVMSVIIGIDPHKVLHAACVIDGDEVQLAELTVRTGPRQIGQLLEWATPFEVRAWAIESGRRARLSARPTAPRPGRRRGRRPLDTGGAGASVGVGEVNEERRQRRPRRGRRRVRAPSLPTVRGEDHVTVLRLLAKAHLDVGRARSRACSRLHALVNELIPGGISKEIVVNQARSTLAGIEATSVAQRQRLELAVELLEEIAELDTKLKRSKARIATAVTASATTLTEMLGVGPIIAAMLIGYTGDPARFPTAGHFAAYNGTAPVEFSTSGRTVHRLSPTRQPHPEPRHPSHRRDPDPPPPQRRPRLLRHQDRRRQPAAHRHAGLEASHQQPRLPAPPRRRRPGA